ncbi:uncharacterized protein LOC143205270 isoform X2 [Rhynchophorus ferrugineus]|uniref:uncharacterized protein LOC143205270 isoform X2 n=1 Tax=Rhynchophorus ferrugineus TaxID=354439 RepID=UPI003FCD5B91
MSTIPVFLVLLNVMVQIFGAPSPDVQGQGTISGSIPPLLTFKDGNIGVNFLGFKASAGLGGLLNGDSTQGGLHAEAETPFGQKAGAGLGGRVGANGRSIGGLYAGATAGGGIGAEAGLGGSVDENGARGGSFTSSSGGRTFKTVLKERYSGAAPVGASISGSLHVHKEVAPAVTEVEVTKEEVPLPPPKKTYVERTVIPNYVEKTIHVPSYVEKTIRVPTVIEKRIKVPAPPTVIEKEIEVPQPVVTATKVVQKDVVPEGVVVTKTKTKLRRRPGWHFAKYINVNSGEVPYYGGAGHYAAAYGGHFDGDSNCNTGGCQ